MPECLGPGECSAVVRAWAVGWGWMQDRRLLAKAGPVIKGLWAMLRV